MPLQTSAEPSSHHLRRQVGAKSAGHRTVSVVPRCTAHAIPRTVACHHEHAATAPQQCCSVVVQRTAAPVATVWSVVRRFDQPQAYERFIRSCHVVSGDGGVGTVREVRFGSGLPASSSREKLEILDDEQHVLGLRVVGGENRLANYRSVTTVHAAAAAEDSVGEEGAVVVESYVVDVPAGNTEEETRLLVDTIIRFNLKWLAGITEDMYRRGGGAS